MSGKGFMPLINQNSLSSPFRNIAASGSGTIFRGSENSYVFDDLIGERLAASVIPIADTAEEFEGTLPILGWFIPLRDTELHCKEQPWTYSN